jgi:hypothetical protein
MAPSSAALRVSLNMEVAGSFETLVNIYQTALIYILEDSNLHSHCHGNLISHFSFMYNNFQLLLNLLR